jgi:hypothetical protein
VAGTGKAGFADGPAKTAQFNEPIAVAVERTGAIYVADRNNHRIRKISPDGTVITLAGGDSVGFVDGDLKSARFNQPYGVALDAAQTTLYVADYLNHAIRRINLVLEKVDTLAGNGARLRRRPARHGALQPALQCARGWPGTHMGARPVEPRRAPGDSGRRGVDGCRLRQGRIHRRCHHCGTVQ